jgi:hypothetical protein
LRFGVQTYLEEVLPVLLSQSADLGPKPTTVIQFIVVDLDRGDWFYVIEGDHVEVKRGLSDRADLTLSFYSRDLGDLSEDKLNVKRAVRISRIKVMGDEQVLSWLSTRLAG